MFTDEEVKSPTDEKDITDSMIKQCKDPIVDFEFGDVKEILNELKAQNCNSQNTVDKPEEIREEEEILCENIKEEEILSEQLSEPISQAEERSLDHEERANLDIIEEDKIESHSYVSEDNVKCEEKQEINATKGRKSKNKKKKTVKSSQQKTKEDVEKTQATELTEVDINPAVQIDLTEDSSASHTQENTSNKWTKVKNTKKSHKNQNTVVMNEKKSKVEKQKKVVKVEPVKDIINSGGERLLYSNIKV